MKVSVLFLFAELFLHIPMLALVGQAPTNATPGSFNRPVAWPPGTYVTVYIDVSTIPQGSLLYNTIASRIQDSSGTYGNGVTYSTPVPISGCPDVNTTCPLVASARQLFTGGSVQGDEGAENRQSYNNSSPDPGPIQKELASQVVIDSSKLTTSDGAASPNFDAHVVSHEIEHDFGVGDDPDADPSLTLMTYRANGDDPGLTEPSEYDYDLGFSYSGGGGGSGGDPSHSYCYDDPLDPSCTAKQNDN